MERQYIWFRTGAGCAAAALGSLLATIAALVVLLADREVSVAHFALVFALYAIGLLPAFLVDRGRSARSCSGFMSDSDPRLFSRFTDRARRVMQLADEEAGRLSHEYIGTEHILLGLVEEGQGVAAHVLKNLNIDSARIHRELDKIILPGPDVKNVRSRSLTPKGRSVVELARDESHNLNHNYIGTEHILLGLLREEEGVAAQVLMNLGVRLADVREGVVRLLGDGMPTAPPESAQANALLSGQGPQQWERLSSPWARQAIRHAVEEAVAYGHDDFGTGHLLLGLLRNTHSVATMALKNLGLTPGDVRKEVLKLLEDETRRETDG